MTAILRMVFPSADISSAILRHHTINQAVLTEVARTVEQSNSSHFFLTSHAFSHLIQQFGLTIDELEETLAATRKRFNALDPKNQQESATKKTKELLNQIQEQRTAFQARISQLEHDLKSERQHGQAQASGLRQEVAKLQESLAVQSQHSSFLEQQIQEIQQATEETNLQKDKHRRSLQAKVAQFQEDVVRLKEEVSSKDSEIARRAQQIQIKVEKSEKAKTAYLQLQEKYKESSKLVIEKQEKITQLKQEIEREFKTNRGFQNEGKDNARLLDEKDKEIERLNKSISEFEYEIDALRLQVQMKEKKNSQIRQEIKASKSEILSLANCCREKENEITKARASFQALEIERYSYFLQHKILPDFPPLTTQFICKHIEQFNKGARIKQTRLLYTFDPLNKNKFHLYIEGKPHLLVVIRLNKQRVIAGYLNMPILKRLQYHGHKALMILPLEQDVFFLKQNGKAFNYDDYYLIIGNAELRIKTGDRKIFSNFGILNSYFDCRGKKANYLLGRDDTNQPVVESYEFHQVIFSGQKKTEYDDPPTQQQIMSDL